MARCNHYGCSKQSEDGRKQCRPHLDASSAYQNARRANLISEGRCTHCTGPARSGKTMCQSCADKWGSYLKFRRSDGQADAGVDE